MDWKKFVEEGETIRTHTPLKGWKALQSKTFSGEGHTTIWAPGEKVK